MIDYWQNFGASALESAKELESINSQVLGQLTSAQMELANTAIESGTRYVSALSEAKGYEQIIAEQGKVYAEFNDQLANSMRASGDAMMTARDAYQAWFEKGLQAIPAAANFADNPFQPAATKTRRKKAA